MESDNSNSRSVSALHVDSGTKVGLELKKGLQNLVKPSVKSMDGEEKKSGLKKRLKPVEIGFDSDDEEPIGVLLKLKKPRNPKKVKVGLDGGGEKGKLVEVRDVKLMVEDDDLGGMDDTLASFRKKLKGPKRDSGSGVGRGRSSVLNMVESSDILINGPIEDGGLDAKLVLNVVEKGRDIGGDESDATMDKRVDNKRKGKVKRPKVDFMGKTIGGHTVPDDGLGHQKEPGLWPGEGSNLSSAENLEDSLSAFFQKTQSGLIMKSRTSSRLKEKNTAHSLDDGVSPSSGADSVDFQSVAVRKLQSASDPTSKLTCKNLESEDSSHMVSGSSPIDSTAEQIKPREGQRFKDSLCQVSDCIEDNQVAIQVLSSFPAVTGNAVRSSNNEVNRYSKALSGDPAPYPPSFRSHAEGIREGPTVDHCGSNNGFNGDTEEFICVKVNGNCSAPSEVATLEIRTLEDGLKQCSIGKASDLVYDVVERSNSVSALKKNEEILALGEVESNRGFSNALDQQPKSVSTMYISSADPEICSSLAGKDSPVPCFDNELLNKPHENTSKDVYKLCSGRVLEASSKSLSQNSPNVGETWTDCDGAKTSTEEPDLASVLLQKENDVISDGRLTPITTTSSGIHESGFALQMNNAEKSLETCDIADPSYPGLHPNESVASIEKCKSDNQPSDDASKGTCVPSHDYLLVNEKGDGDSSPSSSATPDQNESYPEDAVSVRDPENKDNKLSAVRAMRNPKKRRHGDMAYEGDADWEILVHEQGFLDSHQVVDSDRPFRAREKLDSSSNIDTNAENGGLAAVSAGLKARAAGPVEKIKFKEVLRRKGGLQEYLECRNQILGIWSKDVSRILPLSDCGVTDTPSEDESARASLIREIYTFLDQSGYINVGIASEKKKVEPSAEHNYKLLKEKKFDKKSGALVVESEDGVSFILGRVKGAEASMEAKNGVIFDNGNQISEATEGRGLLPPKTLQLPTECDECPADKYQGNCCIDEKLPNSLVNLDVLTTDQSCELLDTGTVPAITPELVNESYSVQSVSNEQVGGNHHLQSDLDVRKRIIVVGAGPAGLNAARHLQRQGFSVSVLEARSRIGGRVYTDFSSLSVPVDLGASIITGVEADVATERRPDPSSLVCAQLGLELTVLNSDCPLYDIITGEKVPADLDEALEAEYNSLLDDMVLLVAQQGEHAMRMSLEDGLEYALKSRRTARLGSADEETELHNSVDAFFDSKRVNVDGRVPEKNCSKEDILSPFERRVMNWHFANLEYGCAALLKEVSLPYWNQDDIYGGFGGAHCMIKGGYSSVVESLGEGLSIHLNHVVTDISYSPKESGMADGNCNKVKVSTSNGSEFLGDAVLITVPLGCLKAGAIQFSPPLPQWKHSSIQRLGFGVLNKVALEFPEVFWDDSVDYFGATAEESDQRGQCFMFWNVRKTVGAPVLIALVVGKAAINGQNMSSLDHVNHALMVLRKLFGEASVPDPVASVVTNWGKDPFSYGAYSYVAVGSSGEDYDILGRPVENCLFFAGEATCKEHPDTVGGAMMSGLREAVRIIDILSTGNDYTAEVEAMEAAQRQSDSERDEVRDITKRLDAIELSNVLYRNSLDGAWILSREALLQDLFFNAKATAGRLRLAKELLNLPVETLKSFAGTREGLTKLNSWILDSMGKDGTQLLRHCVRLLVLVSTDLLAVRLSGIGKTVKEKVCVHTSRDIRAIASQLVSVWLEVFRKEKASNGGIKLLKHTTAVDSSKAKYHKDSASWKPPLRSHNGAMDNKRSLQVPASTGCHLPSNANHKKVNSKLVKLETTNDSKSEANSSRSGGSIGRLYTKVEEDNKFALSEEEQAAFAAAEAARAVALAAAEAFASEAKCNTMLQLPKIPSFHKFARREQYAQMDESDLRRRWSGGVLGRQDCISEIDSRNCRVRDWSVDFSAACVKLDSSRMSVDNLSQRSHSNEIACQLNFREQSGESAAVDSSLFTKAWVDSAGSVGIKDYHAIERWQSQAAAADSDFFHPTMHLNDEEDSNTILKPPTWKHDRLANESSVSQVTTNKELQSKRADLIKQAVVDYVASLLMPLYKARKIDKEGYKSIMKKTATKVMEQATDAEKAMAVSEFLDFKRKNKIRSFVDKLIERHMAMKPVVKH